VGGPINLTGAELFGWFKQPVTSTADFDGLKFRTAGVWGEVVDSLGGSVVTLPGGEVYQAFERGVVDAFEFCCPSMDWAMGFQDLGAYMHVPGIHSTCAVTLLHVSKTEWEALPADIQSIIENASYANASRSVYWMDTEDAVAMEKFKEYGTEIVTLPDAVQAEIVEQADAMYDRYSQEDEFFAEVVKSKREFFDSYRYLKNQVQPTYD
jgi:TRAP-type mannitol/chloroaromatic compound transport system substrate-binding protein